LPDSAFVSAHDVSFPGFLQCRRFTSDEVAAMARTDLQALLRAFVIATETGF
jgi:hypothetical protein